VSAAAGAPPLAAGAVGQSAAESSQPVHLNTATLEDLDALPGVGPVTAQQIIDYRAEHGAFRTVDELDAVPGIGPARLEQLRELVEP
jgi:competence protein ComEA